MANTSGKHFIAALLKSLSVLFGIRVITVSTGAATHINESSFLREMKARHATGVILESEKDPSTHILVYVTPDLIVMYPQHLTSTVLATVELVGASFTGGNYVYNNSVLSYVVAVAILADGIAKIFKGQVHTKCFLCPVGNMHFNLKNEAELKKFCEMLVIMLQEQCELCEQI